MFIVYFLDEHDNPIYLADPNGAVSYDIRAAHKFTDRVEAYRIGRDIADELGLGKFNVLAISA